MTIENKNINIIYVSEKSACIKYNFNLKLAFKLQYQYSNYAFCIIFIKCFKKLIEFD
jgi:hypothetical protein